MAGAAARSTYSLVAIWLHWIIGAAIILNIAIALIGGMMPWHKAIGITVLALSIVRWIWRLTHRPPPLPANVPAWQKGASHALHWTFYLLIVLMPLTGWIMSSGAETRRPLNWFGLFDIPYLPVSHGAPIVDVSHEFHELVGLGMIALILLHVAAALKHHLIGRDSVLHRMLPVIPSPQR